MAFKGTAKRKVGEISALIETNGGKTNAYTSFDETVYYIIMPSEKLELALDLLGDMVFQPTYDTNEYVKEKEVVVEEIRMGMDNPGNLLVETFLTLAFTEGHPYGHRVIGWPETVKNATRDVALAFHDKFYRPDNCVVIVTGGFDPSLAKKYVETHFGAFKNPEAPLPPITGLYPESEEPKVKVIFSKEATLPKLLVGFHSPPAGHSLIPTAELLSALLSGGRSARLEERIKNEKGLVSSVQSANWELKRGSVFYISLDVERDKVIGALKELVGELNALGTRLPSEDEIKRARALASKSFVDSQEAPWALGSIITSWELSAGDYRLKDAYLPIWGRLTPSDVADFARSIFSSQNASAVLLLPEGASPITEEELKTELQKIKLPPAPKAPLMERPPFAVNTLSNGVKVLILKDKSLPLVELKAGVLGGRYAEEKGKEGVVNLMSMVWTKASKKRDSEKMAADMDSLGLSLDGFAGRSSLGLDSSFVSDKWRESLTLFTEILTEPVFAEKDFQIKKKEQLDYIVRLDEDLRDRVLRLNRANLFKDHPFALDLDGTTESVAALKREDLIGVYQKLIRPENLIITVAGDIEPAEFLEALEESFKNWKPAGEALKITVPDGPPSRTDFLSVSEILDREQTHIILGFLGPDMKSPDRAPLEVLNSILSGMGGILFTELRDKKSLAYSVFSDYSPYMKTGAMLFYIGTASEKSAESYQGMLDIIKDSSRMTYPPEVVEGAVNQIVGSDLMSSLALGSVATEALNFSITGQPLDYRKIRLALIKKVTPEDVKRVAEKYLNPDRAVLTVVGSEPSWEKVKALLPQTAAKEEIKDAAKPATPNEAK
jgi:zinc protease